MKIKVLLFVLLMTLCSYAQVAWYNTNYLFSTSSLDDTLIYNTTFVVSPTGATEFSSRPIYGMSAIGSTHITGVLESVSGTANTAIYYDQFMGNGYNGAADGYEEHQLYSGGVGSFSVNLSDSTWYLPSPKWRIRVVETGSQETAYQINIFTVERTK